MKQSIRQKLAAWFILKQITETNDGNKWQTAIKTTLNYLLLTWDRQIKNEYILFDIANVKTLKEKNGSKIPKALEFTSKVKKIK